MKVKENFSPSHIQNADHQPNLSNKLHPLESLRQRISEWLKLAGFTQTSKPTHLASNQLVKPFTAQHFEDMFKRYENLSFSEPHDLDSMTDAILNCSIGCEFLMEALEALKEKPGQDAKIHKARLMKIHHIAAHAIRKNFQLSKIVQKLEPVLDHVEAAHVGKLAKLCEALFQKNEGHALLDKAFEIYAKTRNEIHCEVVENIMICALQNGFQTTLIENKLTEVFPHLNWCQREGAKHLYVNLFKIKLGEAVLMKALSIINQASMNSLGINDELVVSAALIIRAAFQADYSCELMKENLTKNSSKEVFERYFNFL